MKKSLQTLAIILLAILIAAGSTYLLIGWYNVMPWAIAALIIGLVTNSRRDSIILGAIFGYVLFLFYIWFGYNGKTDAKSMTHFVLFDVSFSLIGGLAGVAGAFTGHWLKRRFEK